MNAVFAGAACGLLMASIFVSAASFVMFSLLKDAGPSPMVQRLPPTKLVLMGVAVAYPLWCIIGAVTGLLYQISAEVAPGPGIGSPNLVFTLSVLLVTITMAAPFAVLLRRAVVGVLVVAVSFIGLFGWFFPFFAS